MSSYTPPNGVDPNQPSLPAQLPDVTACDGAGLYVDAFSSDLGSGSYLQELSNLTCSGEGSSQAQAQSSSTGSFSSGPKRSRARTQEDRLRVKQARAERNRASAERSRIRKKMTSHAVAERAANLEQENASLKERVKVLAGVLHSLKQMAGGYE